jgi:two-component system, OmpR family, response regulator
MKILVVEDDLMLHEPLLFSLRQHGHLADGVTSLSQAQVAMEMTQFDVLLLDLGLPDGDGLDLLKQIRAAKQPILVLILTARDAINHRVKGLKLGADDYLSKPFSTDELLARIEALSRRSRSLAPAFKTIGLLRVDSTAQRAWINEAALDLPAREWAVLNALVDQVDRIVPKERLISMVSRWDEDLSPNAIETYVSRLRVKLEPAGLHVRTIRGLGYLLSVAPRS